MKKYLYSALGAVAIGAIASLALAQSISVPVNKPRDPVMGRSGMPVDNDAVPITTGKSNIPERKRV